MRTSAFSLLPIFRSELQARLLALLFLNPDREWPGPELARRTETARQTVNDEVRRLGAAGLVIAKTTGTAKLYRAPIESPLYEPLRELIEKTLGVEVALVRVLADVPGIESAAIYGSWAAGHLHPTSDLDLLIIGEVDFDDVSDVVREVEELAGREIGINVYTREELNQRIASGGGFIKNILSREMKPLIGDVESLGEEI